MGHCAKRFLHIVLFFSHYHLSLYQLYPWPYFVKLFMIVTLRVLVLRYDNHEIIDLDMKYDNHEITDLDMRMRGLQRAFQHS